MQIDPAQPLTTAGEELNDLQIVNYLICLTQLGAPLLKSRGGAAHLVFERA